MENYTNNSTLTVQGFTPYAQVPRWILRAGDSLSHGAVRLYGVIMTYADNTDRTAFPERETLAADMGVSVATIKRCIKELEDYKALSVNRRRNKRTGNFYANHYTLVFNNPWVTGDSRRGVTDDPVTRSTSLTTSTGFTSEQSSEQSVSPSLSKRRKNDASKQNFKAENADPISPTFYHSNDRQILLQNIQSIAKAQVDHGVGSQLSEDMIDALQVNLETAFGSDCIDELDGMIHDYAWIPKRTHVEKKRAAIWLNQLLNEWSDLSGGLQWRGEHVVYEE